MHVACLRKVSLGAIGTVGLAAILWASLVNAEQTSAGAIRGPRPATETVPNPGSHHPMPLHHKYRYFLLYQMRLDQKADSLSQQGRQKEATAMRKHIQRDLRFTDEQIAIVREAGVELKNNLDQVMQEAAPVIEEDRQWLKAHGRAAGPPPGAPQIHQLREEQETFIKDAVANLNRQLGPEPASRLQAYVETHLKGNLKNFPTRKVKPGTAFHPEAAQ